ncbi:MAG: lasso peptide biosynthesis B2 protein [Myxococcales bacterium]|nr:lasso peptide biosynthesis B2 protein [Myxococcales bacterium]MCB9693015.1 lasso peptide biosynthesis B2 protein [Alphaproteobacteria bacterium]
MGRISATLEVVGVLGVTGLGLRTVGFAPVWDGVSAVTPTTSELDVGATLRRVERWGRWVPGARLCLPQALAGAALLRRHGVPGELVIGVRGSPFEAHAWLVHEGQTVLGAREQPGYTPIWRAPF